jgi:hypothetical protein
MRLSMNEGLRVSWWRSPAAYVPLALVLMPVVIHAAMRPVTDGQMSRASAGLKP